MPDTPTPPEAGAPATGQPAVPGPGHFLPSDAGPGLGDVTPRATRRRRTEFTKAAPVRGQEPVRRRGAPIPTEPGQTGYGAPPPPPLNPVTGPLTHDRRRVGSWDSVRRNPWQQDSDQPGPYQSGPFQPASPYGPLLRSEPPRRTSRQALAGLFALVLVALAGAGVAGYQTITDTGPLASPVQQPAGDPGEVALPAPPQPTETVTVPAVPDAERVQKNKLYTVGRIPTVECREPAVRPSTEAAVMQYYRALLPCLNRAWEPLVRKAGYPFRAPKLVAYAVNRPSCQVKDPGLAFYCGTDETIFMQAKLDAKNFRGYPEQTRVDLMDTLAHEYGHHVQMLTNILISSASRQGWATTEAAELLENRRMELQASCLAAAFLGAHRDELGFTGSRLRQWQYQAQHSGDEYNPKRVRDHGSRKSNWLWTGPAFRTADPRSCNTFTAPAAKVN